MERKLENNSEMFTEIIKKNREWTEIAQRMEISSVSLEIQLEFNMNLSIGQFGRFELGGMDGAKFL